MHDTAKMHQANNTHGHKTNEIKQTQASTETDETKDTSHLVNVNKKQKLYMALFDSSATTINLSDVVLPAKK